MDKVPGRSGPEQQLEMLGGFVAFVSIPTTEDCTAELGALADAAAAVERLTGESIEIVTGLCAPDQSPAALRAWIRGAFAQDVDALIELHGSSFGCGHEDGLASVLRIPRLLAFHEKASRSNAAGGDGMGLLDEGRYRSATELRELATKWLLEALPRMRTRRLRRERGAEMVGDVRRRVLRALEGLGDEVERKLAAELELTRRQLLDVCYDDVRFSELSAGDVRYLEWALGLTANSPDDEPATATATAAVADSLTPRQQRAFDQARRTWGWDDATAQAVIHRGLRHLAESKELEAAGMPSRFSLETRLGWRNVYRELCDERG